MAYLVDIVEWAESPYGFYTDRYWEGTRWVLQPAPIKLAHYHADILRHAFMPDEYGQLRYDTITWCEPAKSGKSAIAGLITEYCGLHLDGDVILASNKQNQAASIMYRSLTDSIQYNPHLPNISPNRYEVQFANGNSVRAIPSNSRGEAGARFSLAVFDELWGYVYQDAERLWTEFKTDPTRVNSVRLAIGYAGYDTSKLWQDLLNVGLAGAPVRELEHIANQDGDPCCWANERHFTFWSHITRQPWQTEKWIETQRKALRPAEFSRMIETYFVHSIGDFLAPGVWESLIDPGHTPLPPGSRKPVWIGLDIATKPGGDDCALVGLYVKDDTPALAFHQIWKGGKDRRHPLKLSTDVQPLILQLAQAYNIQGIYFDPYQALQLAEELRRAGIDCIEIKQSHANRGPRDTALWEACVTGNLVLYPDPEIEQAATYTSAKELGDNQLFLVKGGRGKIDFMVAVSNCYKEAAQGCRAHIY